jgi:hypothetical protein
MVLSTVVFSTAVFRLHDNKTINILGVRSVEWLRVTRSHILTISGAYGRRNWYKSDDERTPVRSLVWRSVVTFCTTEMRVATNVFAYLWQMKSDDNAQFIRPKKHWTERIADISRGRCCAEWNSRLNKVFSFGEFSPKTSQDSSLSVSRTDWIEWILRVSQILSRWRKVLSFGQFNLKMCSNEGKIFTQISEFAASVTHFGHQFKKFWIL